MEIGNIELKYGLIQAPLEGISNRVFRRIMREHGAEMSWGERANAEGLVRGCRRNLALFETDTDESPLALQISGGSEGVLVNGAIIAETFGADVVDINMGCPSRKVCAAGAGAGLLRDPSRAERMLAAVRRALHVPMTVKIRSGWDGSSINAVEVARAAEQAGAAAIAVHPRTRAQGYQGPADWDLIAQVKQAVRIPVVGNGDLHDAEDIRRMYAQTGCDGVMVARGMLGNPWIFRDYRRLADGLPIRPPTPKEVCAVILDHLDRLVEATDALSGVVQMRKHLGWYVRGLADAAAFRDRVMRLSGLASIREEVSAFFEGQPANLHETEALPA